MRNPGWVGADIEGIVDGRTFRFSASNPDACDSAKPVDEILDLIQAAYYNKEPD